MKRYIILICLTLLIGSFLVIPAKHDHIPLYKGVCFVGGRIVDDSHFAKLAENKVNWISQTPFAYQNDYNKPKMRMNLGRYAPWGESKRGISETTRLAKKYGIKTILKPHIWMRSRGSDKWRSDIAMESEADWQEWFENYTRFIVHYATLADSIGIEALSIGTELHQTVVQKPDEWRKIIKKIRAVYKGKLTYSGNWYKEFEDVTFWDDLDFIGVQGYFPLSDKKHPSVEEMKKGWETHIPQLRALHKKYNKQIVFTEIGYKSSPSTAITPWEWHEEFSAFDDEISLKTQADCYEAFFQTFWNEPWFDGVFFWKWFPDYTYISGRGSDLFSPQYKPAEKVMQKWFGH